MSDVEWDRAIADLHGDDIDRYVSACERVDALATPERLPQLLALLADSHSLAIREAAAAPVARLRGVAALPAMLAAKRRGTAEGHDNDGLAAVICDTVEADPTGAAPILRKLFDSPDAADRADAAWLWGFTEGALEVEPLFRAARDQDADVRADAMGALSSFKGREDVFAELVRGLDDPSPGVRASAASSLGYYGDARAATPLARLRDDPDAHVRRIAEYAASELSKAR